MKTSGGTAQSKSEKERQDTRTVKTEPRRRKGVLGCGRTEAGGNAELSAVDDALLEVQDRRGGITRVLVAVKQAVDRCKLLRLCCHARKKEIQVGVEGTKREVEHHSTGDK